MKNEKLIINVMAIAGALIVAYTTINLVAQGLGLI